MNDLSLLLSTTATASAALIAIVGGLLVSRVVSLSTERRGLLHRQDDATVQVRHARERVEDLAERLLRWDASDIIEDNLGELALLPDDPDIEQVVRESRTGRDAVEIEPFVQTKIEELRSIREEIEPFFAHGAPGPNVYSLEYESDDFEIPAGSFDEYEAAFNALRAERGPHREDPISTLITPSSLGQSDSVFINQELREQGARAAYEQLRRDVEAADHELARREAELAQVQAALVRVSSPAGVGWGAAVLAYFATVGVLFPMMLLLDPKGQSSWMAGLVIALFASGMTALILYIVITVRRLSKPRG